ncbi:DMT family transporter [Paracoccus versutus]|uniref:Drug/metabolite transporter (DMT)-like permease n=1 Tax=Paracoccus versutus TaxID=34007 RepID=A0AAQ0KLR5_PARVE|nr:DMT family transporter [Paracoccus versutus]KGJ07580.1 membrane protein [Paracoccus versutus]REG45874.1 drug/metabolite transporter (DMT)-like permease [Paracoccus versutus]WEJ77680.1 DMT family transporter [Paracoccus versutus]
MATTVEQAEQERFRWIWLLLLLPPPLFWAGNFLVGRMMRDMVPPFTLLTGRWIIALLILLPFAIAPMRRDFHLYRRHWLRLVAVSLTGIVAFNAFIYVGLRTTTASNGLLLNSLIPLLILLVAAITFRQRIGGRQIAAILLSFAGVLTILTQGVPERLLALDLSRGDLIVFGGMISWAFYTVWLRGFPAGIDRIGLMGAQITVGLIALLPVWLWEHAHGPAPIWTGASVAALAYLGIFPSVGAYLLYNMAVARVGVARAGLSIHLIPVFGVILAVLFMDESLHLYHLLGAAAIMGGIAVSMRDRR